MHGTSDVNAPLSTTMRMLDALIRANKNVELLLMPGQAHHPEAALEPYYRRDIWKFFVRELGRSP